MRRVAAIALVALLALPAAASAGVRYAAPGGGITPGCPEATPCSLQYAVTGAASGDEVVVGPGTYEVPATIQATVPLTIRGSFVSEKPRIVGASGVTPLESTEKQVLRNLAVESSEAMDGTLFMVGDESSFDHLEAIARGANSVALRPGNRFTLTNSLLEGSGTESIGIFVQATESGDSFLRNDTIVASGTKSEAVTIYVTLPGASTTLKATNVIADAATDAAAGATSTATGKIEFDHSNLDTMTGEVTSTAGQAAPPQFLNAGAGDYHEAGTSPTIDAGVNDPANGETDLDGNPRAMSGGPPCEPPPPGVTDIGAYEYRPVEPAIACRAPFPRTKITRAKIRRRKRSAAFTFRAIGMATGFECELIRRGHRHRKKPVFRRCSSPKAYRRLEPGRYVFKVRAVNGGLTDPSPAVRKFRI